MKHLSKLFLIASIFSAINLHSQNKSISFAHGKWAEILEKSKKENKMIYLDCYTTWCGPCKWMAKNVFTNDTVADFYNSNFINVEMDMEKGEGLEIAKKYGIQAYPTMLYINSSGEIMHRSCGSAPTQTFIATGKTALNPNTQLASLTKTFNSGAVDGKFAYKYISALENGCQKFDNELSSYFAGQKERDLSSRSNWNMIYAFINNPDSREFVYLENNKEVFSKLYTADSVNKKINRIYRAGLEKASSKQDKAAFDNFKNKIKNSGLTDAEKIIAMAEMNYLATAKDWKNYALAGISTAEKFYMDDANTLNSIAWSYYENIDDKEMLLKAGTLAKRSIELESMYANNDTYAAILYKLGKKDEAEKAAVKAIELAKAEGSDFTETTELLKKIEQLQKQ
jgi:thiol-disulfide isomerase/thioredoxin